MTATRNRPSLTPRREFPVRSPQAPARVWRRRFSIHTCALSLGLLGALVGGGVAAEIPEPDTVFYGKIINRSYGHEYQMTEGALTWVIRRQSASPSAWTLTARLESLAGGEYSYRLKVPHEALSLGLTLSGESIPLALNQDRFDHLDITVDGERAQIRGSTRRFFEAAQKDRASAYRLDLEVTSPLPDSDQDHIPDWWERANGLDPFAAADAETRHPDGLTNLDKFRLGAKPTDNNRPPRLLPDRLVVYDRGVTLFRPHVIDADDQVTTATDEKLANLVFTITEAPSGGTLFLRGGAVATNSNGLWGDRALRANHTFTLKDAENGRILFVHEDPSVRATSFRLSLTDSTPGHPAVQATIPVEVFSPIDLGGHLAATWYDADAETLDARNDVWIDTVQLGDVLYRGSKHLTGAPLRSATGALVDGGTGESPAPSWAGQVVLVKRGGIDFNTKVRNVEAAGGVAAIFYHNQPGEILGDIVGFQPQIPAVGLSQIDGEALRAQVQGTRTQGEANGWKVQ